MPDGFSDTLVERLSKARSVAALTGAGVSAESGVPTFRDPGGLWERYRPEELASVRAFLSNPALVQGWYEYRRTTIRSTEPNPGHLALVDLEKLIPDFTLITQNVDDLHRRAGSRNLVELHGNIMRSYCIECEREAAEEELHAAAGGHPAICPGCGGYIRPDVVWFGELLPGEAVRRAEDAAARADVFLTIGTSALVYPAAGIPLLARDSGSYVAEINVERSTIADKVDEVVLGKSGKVLPQLVEAVKSRLAKG